ncbi:MAG: methyltransferase domain-containing protein [Desulfurococcales archaeon]|nr:methyltransferase domain-containing protein [Desulfurococcales archaeon]
MPAITVQNLGAVMPGIDVFEALADRYDSWFERNRIIAEAEARLVSSMVDKRPILEIGAGTGFFASRVSAEAGIDPSISMLSRAARRMRYSLLVRGVGERLPFRDSVFSTVLVVVTLCFVEDPRKVLLESRRVLTGDGDLVACIVPRDTPWGIFYEELGRTGHPFYSRARFLSLGELRRLILGAGFEITEERGVLGFAPHEEPRLEKPSGEVRGKGFVCVKAVKRREAARRA